MNACRSSTVTSIVACGSLACTKRTTMPSLRRRADAGTSRACRCGPSPRWRRAASRSGWVAVGHRPAPWRGGLGRAAAFRPTGRPRPASSPACGAWRRGRRCHSRSPGRCRRLAEEVAQGAVDAEGIGVRSSAAGLLLAEELLLVPVRDLVIGRRRHDRPPPMTRTVKRKHATAGSGVSTANGAGRSSSPTTREPPDVSDGAGQPSGRGLGSTTLRTTRRGMPGNDGLSVWCEGVSVISAWTSPRLMKSRGYF